MFDRIINILILESNEVRLAELLEILESPGHNILVAKNNLDAIKLVNSKTFTLVFCSIDDPKIKGKDFIHLISSKEATKHSTIIVTSQDKTLVAETIKSIGKGIDYLITPYIKPLVLTKIEVYKKLHYKHLRVSNLLESILPKKTLKEFASFGKSSPKKRKNCVVLFTDFADFTKKTQKLEPESLVKKLDYYFSRFDEIMQKYDLEKIKTIGDAYMAVGGVTESTMHAAERTALAAIEIRNFIATDIATQKALGKDYWEIRIGIHIGDLIAGVVGKKKFSFDVWGDTVNIAARCEQHSRPGKINITAKFESVISPYFNVKSRGPIKIKNAGEIEMFYLTSIKKEYSLYGEGRIPNVALRTSIGLPHTDFEGLRSYILTRMKSELNEKLIYHSIHHTLGVERAVIKYGKLERLAEHEMILLRTAALFHDSGFLYRYENNESIAVDLVRHHGPLFGYNEQDLQIIEELIFATSYHAKPKNLMQEILCDADLDYLGRLDYHSTAEKLFNELAAYGNAYNELERIEMQIHYLESHHTYYTASAKNLRNPGKKKRLKELKNKLKKQLNK